MKKLFIALLLVLFTSPAFADQLGFEWGYGPEPIDGFRLYRNGQTVEVAHIAPSARSIIVERQTDQQSHAYHLVAYVGAAESAPSATALDVWNAEEECDGYWYDRTCNADPQQDEMIVTVPTFSIRVIKGN